MTAFVANPVHGLSLGSLVFMSGGQSVVYTEPVSGETYSFKVIGDDDKTTFGNAESITETLVSLLSNGSRVAHRRDDNREPALALRVTASGPAALSAAETALSAVTGRPASLRWQPPAPGAAPTVFEVVWSDLKTQTNWVAERYLQRLYQITLSALPSARSETKTVTPAVTTTAPTVVDSGSATTNWSVIAPTGATLSVVSGAVRLTYNPATPTSGIYGATMRRTATISTSTNKYLSVDWKTSLTSVYGLQTNATLNLAEVRREPGAVSGFTRSWFQVPDAVTSLAWIQFVALHPANTGSATIEIDLVQSANALPVSGSARQKMATIFPGGSAPAQGDILVTHPTAGLGRAIVFTHPVTAGYSPPLRQWLATSDTVVTDAAMVSGARQTITGATDYSIPTASVPEGDVHLWAMLMLDTAGTSKIFWAADTWVGGVQIGTRQEGATSVTWATALTWLLVPLARLTLPTAKTALNAGAVRISIQRDPATVATAFIDEAWLFAMDKGCLTAVDCGTGTPAAATVHNRLAISAPSLANPSGLVMIGAPVNGDYDHVPLVSKSLCDQTTHTFDPDGSMIFTVTSGATDASVALEHYRRWRTYAGS